MYCKHPCVCVCVHVLVLTQLETACINLHQTRLRPMVHAVTSSSRIIYSATFRCRTDKMANEKLRLVGASTQNVQCLRPLTLFRTLFQTLVYNYSYN